MLKIESVTKDYKELLNKIPKGILFRKRKVRWMLKNYEQLFCSAISTPYPVSDKRVKNAIDAC